MMPSTRQSERSGSSALEAAASSRSSICQAGNRTVVDAQIPRQTGITWCVGAIPGSQITMSRTCACSAITTTSTSCTRT